MTEFKDYKELLDFVLTKCNNITYQQFDVGEEISFESNFEIKAIYYAYILMKEKFPGFMFKRLNFCEYKSEIELPEGYLKHMEIKKIFLNYDFLPVLPKLPYTLEEIVIYSNIDDDEYTSIEIEKYTHRGLYSVDEYLLRVNGNEIKSDDNKMILLDYVQKHYKDWL